MQIHYHTGCEQILGAEMRDELRITSDEQRRTNGEWSILRDETPIVT
jgi:hypothetical protein